MSDFSPRARVGVVSRNHVFFTKAWEEENVWPLPGVGLVAALCIRRYMMIEYLDRQ